MSTTGKTPQNTLASVIYCDIKKDSPSCPFVKVAPMTFGLKEWGDIGITVDSSEEAKAIRKRRKKKKQEEEEEDE